MNIQSNIMKIQIPLTYLNNIIINIGIDRHQYHDNFKTVTTQTPYPVIYGGEESLRTSMLVKPNAFAYPKTDKAKQIFEKYASRILVPDRIRWNTAHVLALYCAEPVISNIFYAVKLKVPGEVREYAEKAFVLWLNTTWGMLTVLLSREETEGAWTELKMGQWRLLKALDVSALSLDMLKMLAKVFDAYADKALRRIPEQFNPQNPDPIRIAMDKSFVKVFNPSVDDRILEDRLKEFYKCIHISLQQWIGEKKKSK
jgi:hypothetical protein